MYASKRVRISYLYYYIDYLFTYTLCTHTADPNSPNPFRSRVCIYTVAVGEKISFFIYWCIPREFVSVVVVSRESWLELSEESGKVATLPPNIWEKQNFRYRPSHEKGSDQLFVTPYTLSIFSSVQKQLITTLS